MTFQLNCCGWDGPKEFAYNNEPIDESCYEKLGGGGGDGESGALWSGSNRRSDDGGGDDNALPTKKMKQVGQCTVILGYNLGAPSRARGILGHYLKNRYFEVFTSTYS